MRLDNNNAKSSIARLCTNAQSYDGIRRAERQKTTKQPGCNLITLCRIIAFSPHYGDVAILEWESSTSPAACRSAELFFPPPFFDRQTCRHEAKATKRFSANFSAELQRLPSPLLKAENQSRLSGRLDFVLWSLYDALRAFFVVLLTSSCILLRSNVSSHQAAPD